MLTPFRPATEAQNAVLMAQNTVTISSPGTVGGYKKDRNATVRPPRVRAPTAGRHNGQSAQVLSFPLFLVALSPGLEKVREAPTSIVSVFYSGGRCKVGRYLQPPHRLSFSSIFQCHRRPLAKSCFPAQERCARCPPLNFAPTSRALAPLLVDRGTPRVSLAPCTSSTRSQLTLFVGLLICGLAHEIPTEFSW